MTGKAYYITTLADWQRHAPRFANSHFIVLDAAPSASSVGARHAVPGDNAWLDADHSPAPSSGNVVIPSEPAASAGDEGSAVASESHGGSPAVEARGFSPAKNDAPQAPSDAQLHPQHVFEVQSYASLEMDKDADCRILVLIEADEGVHLSLEDEPAFEPLPHPLAQKPISDAAQAALAPHGVAPGATTFDAAEVLARIHPLLKHRVF